MESVYIYMYTHTYTCMCMDRHILHVYKVWKVIYDVVLMLLKLLFFFLIYTF